MARRWAQLAVLGGCALHMATVCPCATGFVVASTSVSPALSQLPFDRHCGGHAVTSELPGLLAPDTMRCVTRALDGDGPAGTAMSLHLRGGAKDKDMHNWVMKQVINLAHIFARSHRSTCLRVPS